MSNLNERAYRVTFATKHGIKQWRTGYFLDVFARSMKEAISKAEDLWYRDHVAFMFAKKAVRLEGALVAEYPARCDLYGVTIPD